MKGACIMKHLTTDVILVMMLFSEILVGQIPRTLNYQGIFSDMDNQQLDDKQIVQNSNLIKIQRDGFEILIDNSKQILKLHVPEDKVLEFNSNDDSKNVIEAELYPSIKSIKHMESEFIPASILISKAKQFDDVLYAMIENICQYGTENFIGKKKILEGVAEALKTFTNENITDKEDLFFCRSYIHAAASLGGQQLSEVSEIKDQAQKLKALFLSNEFQSKPISFYTWTENLSNIFQQDRFLQQELNSPSQIRLLSKGLSREEKIRNAYKNYLSLIKKLTNPFPAEYQSLVNVQRIQKEKKYSFFPPSKSAETEYIKKLYQYTSIPEGYNLINEIIDNVKSGDIQITLNKDSGWYDYQLYALEPFLLPEKMPEAQKLQYSKTYKKELTNTFKGALALTRETHIKQLEIPYATAAFPEPKIDIYPEISVEPIATYYLRRAQAYSFIKNILQSTFEEATLQNIYRFQSPCNIQKPLIRELNEMASLFYGLYEIVSDEIGLDSDFQVSGNRNTGNEENVKFAREWLNNFPNDPDIGFDNRMMVPVYYDIERKKIKVWAVLGYGVKPLIVSFKRRPTVVSIKDSSGNKVDAKLEFSSIKKDLIYPVFVEIYVDRLLQRDEFRKLCDQYKTQSAILKALKNR